MKKTLSIILSIIMIVCAFPAFSAYAESTFEDGVLTVTGTGSIGGFSHRDDIIKVIINEGITSIADSAFSYCSNLKEVYFPESLETIHGYSFAKCKKLEKADLPSHLRVIGVRAFYGCHSLKKIELPEGLEEIYVTAFYNCRSAAGKLVIPKSVTLLERFAFSHCDSITEIYFEDGFDFGHRLNGDKTFNNCANLQTVYIPGSAKEIPSACFINCPKLKNITLCEGIEVVGGFGGSTSLEKVTLPKSTKQIFGGAFQGCTKLKTVKIQSKLEWIGGAAFASCDSLKILRIPYGVDKVDDMFCGYNLGIDEKTQNVIFTKIENYKIYGKKCKALTDYCKENGFKFIDMYDVKNAGITGLTSKVFTGKSIKPEIAVKLAGITLTKDTDYTVKYSNNTKVGTAKVALTGIGKYKGTLTKTFKINPKPTELTKLTALSKSFKAYWKKVTTQTTGYQIQYSTYKNLNNAKTVTITSFKTGAKTIKNLKAKKYYFVRIRTYKTVNKTKYYSKWSEVLSVKTK